MPSDYIVLRDGTFLNSEVLNKDFTIKTGFGDVTVKTGNIVHIVMQRGLPDELTTRTMDSLKGQIQDPDCSVLLSNNQTTTIPMSKVLSIQFLGHFFSGQGVQFAKPAVKTHGKRGLQKQRRKIKQ